MRKTLVETHRLLRGYAPILSLYDYYLHYIPETLDEWICRLQECTQSNLTYLQRSHKLLLEYMYKLNSQGIKCIDIPESLCDWIRQCNVASDKLPKTGDGVQIVLDMELWFIDTVGHLVSGRATTFEYINDIWYLVIPGFTLRADKCFSSHEALVGVSNTEITTFLNRTDFYFKYHPVYGINIYHNNLIDYGDNYLEAIKAAIITEREHENSG